MFDVGTAVTAAVVDRSGGTITPSLEKGIALLQEGNELSTVRGSHTEFLRFMSFCDEGGRDAL